MCGLLNFGCAVWLKYIEMKTVFSEENYVPQPTDWFRRQSADNAHFYSLYSVMTLKIRSRSPKSNQFFIITTIPYITFGQNPSSDSRDRVQTSFFLGGGEGQNLTFKVLV